MLVKMKYARKLLEKQVGQRDDWPAMRDALTRKRYERHSAKIVTSTVRLGKRIVLNQLSSVPGTPLETRLLATTETSINEERKKLSKASSKKLERLIAAEKVLKITQALRQDQGGRTPTGYQVLAYQGLLYGTNSFEIKRATTHMISAERNHRDEVTWIGNTCDAYQGVKANDVLRRNFLTEIDDTLLRAGKPLTTKEIVRRLGFSEDLRSYTNKSVNHIRASLQLLETMGLIKKLPVCINLEVNRPMAVWLSRENKPSAITYAFEGKGETHYLNTSIEVLSQLQHNPRLLTELYRPQGAALGNPGAIYSTPNIIGAVNELKSSGLIFTKEKIKTKSHDTQLLELTELGKTLWNQTLETGILPEELIKLLIGEKEDNIKAVLRK